MPTPQFQRGWLWVPQQLWKVRGGKLRVAFEKLRFHQPVCKKGRETAT